MNNTVVTPVAGSSNPLNSQNNLLAAAAASSNVSNLAAAGSVMVAPSNVNNFQMDDVQKLKQQLQDIKEQVSCYTINCSELNPLIVFQNSRQCAPSASIASRTWSFCVATARARCAATRSRDALYAARRWKNASCSSEAPSRHTHSAHSLHSPGSIRIFNGLTFLYTHI